MKISSGSDVWPWLIEYAAFTLHAFKQDALDGKSAFERIRGRSIHQCIVAFSEHVHYKPAKSVSIEKAEARWEKGVWLGIIPESQEHIIGTKAGVIKCRAISAMREEE
eukprot:4600183-Karenia_brevis.AAC.1